MKEIEKHKKKTKIDPTNYYLYIIEKSYKYEVLLN